MRVTIERTMYRAVISLEELTNYIKDNKLPYSLDMIHLAPNVFDNVDVFYQILQSKIDEACIEEVEILSYCPTNREYIVQFEGLT